MKYQIAYACWNLPLIICLPNVIRFLSLVSTALPIRILLSFAHSARSSCLTPSLPRQLAEILIWASSFQLALSSHMTPFALILLWSTLHWLDLDRCRRGMATLPSSIYHIRNHQFRSYLHLSTHTQMDTFEIPPVALHQISHSFIANWVLIYFLPLIPSITCVMFLHLFPEITFIPSQVITFLANLCEIYWGKYIQEANIHLPDEICHHRRSHWTLCLILYT